MLEAKIVLKVVLIVMLVICIKSLIMTFLEGKFVVIFGRLYDFHKRLKNKTCYHCGNKLTPQTKSLWQLYTMIKGTEYAVNICSNCHEITNRMWAYYKKDGDQLILDGDKAEIESEIRAAMVEDGLWMEFEKLRLKEQQEIDDANNK